MVLRHAEKGTIVASRVERATNAWSRGVGLLFHSAVAPDEGLWIDRCSAIHTVLMRATIDVYFLDRANRVLKIARDVPPNRLVVTCRGAVTVVELGTGAEPVRDVSVGDHLVLE